MDPGADVWLAVFSPSGDADCGALQRFVQGGERTYHSRHGDSIFTAVRQPTRHELTELREEYRHLSHLLAFPGLRSPRWLLPLDRRLRARALDLYQPVRYRFKLVKRLAQFALRVGLGQFASGRIAVARSAPSPVERFLSHSLGEERVTLLISTGTPGPTRKATIQVQGSEGEVLAYAKLAVTAKAAMRIDHEVEWLRRLELRRDELGVPRLIAEDTIGGCRLVVLAPVAGQPAPLDLSSSHVDWLGQLQDPGSTRPITATEVFRAISGDASRLGSQVRDLVDWLAEVAAHVEVPTTVIHGDFAPANVLATGEGLRVIDWEHAIEDGVPLWDACHYILQPYFQKRPGTHVSMERALFNGLRHYPEYSEFEKRLLAVVYLLSWVVERVRDGFDPAGRQLRLRLDFALHLGGSLGTDGATIQSQPS